MGALREAKERLALMADAGTSSVCVCAGSDYWVENSERIMMVG